MAWLHAQVRHRAAFGVGYLAAALSQNSVQQTQPLVANSSACCPPCRGATSLGTDTKVPALTYCATCRLPCLLCRVALKEHRKKEDLGVVQRQLHSLSQLSCQPPWQLLPCLLPSRVTGKARTGCQQGTSHPAPSAPWQKLVAALQSGLGENKENKGLGVSEAASVVSQDAEGTQVKLMGTISFDADYVPGEAPSPRITSQVGSQGGLLTPTVSLWHHTRTVETAVSAPHTDSQQATSHHITSHHITGRLASVCWLNHG